MFSSMMDSVGVLRCPIEGRCLGSECNVWCWGAQVMGQGRVPSMMGGAGVLS